MQEGQGQVEVQKGHRQAVLHLQQKEEQVPAKVEPPFGVRAPLEARTQAETLQTPQPWATHFQTINPIHQNK